MESGTPPATDMRGLAEAMAKMEGKMKATVDKNECVGCGLCCDTCPEVFKLENGVAVVKTDPVPREQETCCRESAEACPVKAISLQD